MTPEQEIERIKRDFRDQWPQLEIYPGIQKAIKDQDPVNLGEIASLLVHGYWFDPGPARRASHPIGVLINDVGLDFENIESAQEYITRYKAANPSENHISTFKRCHRGKIELISN